MQVKISNRDTKFPMATGTFYIAVSCFRGCPPGGLKYTITATEIPAPEKATSSYQAPGTAHCSLLMLPGCHTQLRSCHVS